MPLARRHHVTTLTPGPELLAAGDALFEAERRRLAIRPLAETLGPVDSAMAYAIQQRVVARRVAAGESIVGWKVGLTSAAMQPQLGVDQPDYAPILSGQLIASGSTVERADLISPRVEAEIAVRLARPLRGPGVTLADVLAATDAVAPAIEVIDSRIADWKITLADTIADLRLVRQGRHRRRVDPAWRARPAADRRGHGAGRRGRRHRGRGGLPGAPRSPQSPGRPTPSARWG